MRLKHWVFEHCEVIELTGITQSRLPTPSPIGPAALLQPPADWRVAFSLQDAWPDLRIEVWYPHARESVAATLDQVNGQPDQLFFAADRKREPRSFSLKEAQTVWINAPG
jgi:hypothetical protein